MARTERMAVAAVFMVASAVAIPNRCSSGGECQGSSKPDHVVSILQTKLQMNALKDEGCGKCPCDHKPKSIVSLLQTKLQMNVEDQVTAKEKAEEAADAAEVQNAVDTSIAGARQEVGKVHPDVETPSTKGQKTKLLLLGDPDVVYNHMPKTGGTFVVDVLKHSVQHNLVIEKEFQALTRRDREVAFTIGSIRNPCDYYVSLWAFGGAFRKHVPDRYYGLSPDLNTTEDLQRFSQWLRYIMPNGKPGVLSARLALSYSSKFVISPHSRFAKTNSLHDASTPFLKFLQDTIDAFDTSSVDCWVKTENLENDLKGCLQAYEESTGAAVVDWANFTKAVNYHLPKNSNKSGKGSIINRSPHQPCAFYYNDTDTAFVQNSDQAIFEKFHYDACCAPSQL